ncbi:MAG: transposase [candidate division NC10 bacterium]|nr:transposase [candidate division NC10 bacterium]
MPRQSRLDAPGALHHVICRGIEGQPVFRDDTDREGFVARLEAVLTATRTVCYAWALLPNHVHLLLQSGAVPLPTVMRRLLTGYAVTFNRRHRRHGYVFQNRYKSILCQEEPYFLELVRYIHLNPLRAKMVAGLPALDRYAYVGHSRLVGKVESPWQNTAVVLARFGSRITTARQRYRAFVAEGIALGRRPELTGGGLVRSAGGWRALSVRRRQGQRVKGDERILGERAFVEGVLDAAQERRDRRDHLRARGVDFERLLHLVASCFDLTPEEVRAPSKQPRRVQARSLLCYWAVQELGLSGTTVAATLGATQSAVSRAVRRGERYTVEHRVSFPEDRIA